MWMTWHDRSAGIGNPEEKVRANVFNVGTTEENYNKGMIIEEVCKVVPGVKVNYVEMNEDPRDYRVNFDKIKNDLGYTITKKVPDGVNEIYKLLKTGIVTDSFATEIQEYLDWLKGSKFKVVKFSA